MTVTLLARVCCGFLLGFHVLRLDTTVSLWRLPAPVTVVSPPAHANGDITWACDADRWQKVPLWVCRGAAWLSDVCVKFHITAWSHGSAGLVLDITCAAVGWSKSSVAREWCRCQKEKKVCCAWADRILLQSETAFIPHKVRGWKRRLTKKTLEYLQHN